MTSRHFLPLTLLLVGCASAVEALPSYEPLVCDPAATHRLAFGVQEAGAFFASPGTVPYGFRYLFIDGSCRFWAADWRVDDLAVHGRVRAGTLTDDELRAINAELLGGPWELIDGERYDMLGADAPTVSLWRDALGASCYEYCDERASPTLLSMLDTGWEWARRLAERGAPMDGPVQLVVQPGASPDEADYVLEGTELSMGITYARGFIRAVVEDPYDAAALRMLRGVETSIVVREGDAGYYGAAVDVIPHGDESGLLRPPFPIRM